MTRQQTLRWAALVVGMLAVIGLLLITSGAVDRWSMQTHAEKEMAALKPGHVMPPSTGDGSTASASEGAAQAGEPDRRAGFRPPAYDKLPDGDFGRSVQRGYQIFTNTPQAAPAFVGNTMRCSSCHLDAGRLAGTACRCSSTLPDPRARGR
jgi:cytochrome c